MSDELNAHVTATTETQQTEPDDREPTPERQAELRAAYEANVAAGKAPYERVGIARGANWRRVCGQRRGLDLTCGDVVLH